MFAIVPHSLSEYLKRQNPEESWVLSHPPLQKHIAVCLWVPFPMDCEFCAILLKDACENKVCVGGCSKKTTLLYFSRRKADSSVKK